MRRGAKISVTDFNHPIFGNEPFSRRDVWLWMISTAAPSKGYFKLNGNKIFVEAGQLVITQSRLCKKFGWSKNKVRCFLDALKGHQMIIAESTKTFTLITIKDFSQKYQDQRIIFNAK